MFTHNLTAISSFAYLFTVFGGNKEYDLNYGNIHNSYGELQTGGYMQDVNLAFWQLSDWVETDPGGNSTWGPTSLNDQTFSGFGQCEGGDTDAPSIGEYKTHPNWHIWQGLDFTSCNEIPIIQTDIYDASGKPLYPKYKGMVGNVSSYLQPAYITLGNPSDEDQDKYTPTGSVWFSPTASASELNTEEIAEICTAYPHLCMGDV